MEYLLLQSSPGHGISTAVDFFGSVWVLRWTLSHGRLTVDLVVALLADKQAECVWDCRILRAKLKCMNFLLNGLEINGLNYGSKFYIVLGWEA